MKCKIYDRYDLIGVNVPLNGNMGRTYVPRMLVCEKLISVKVGDKILLQEGNGKVIEIIDETTFLISS